MNFSICLTWPPYKSWQELHKLSSLEALKYFFKFSRSSWIDNCCVWSLKRGFWIDNYIKVIPDLQLKAFAKSNIAIFVNIFGNKSGHQNIAKPWLLRLFRGRDLLLCTQMSWSGWDEVERSDSSSQGCEVLKTSVWWPTSFVNFLAFQDVLDLVVEI